MNLGCPTYRIHSRRDFLRIGGLGLCGLTMHDVLKARATTPNARPKSLIVCWLAGGPPHIDMVDPKPDAPAERRGPYQRIATRIPGIHFTELMPQLAQRNDRFTLIRSVSTLDRPGNHGEGPLYWLTGNPRRTTGTDDYPAYGSAIAKLRPGPDHLPSYVSLGALDSNDASRNTLATSFLGPAFAPLIVDPTQSRDAMTRMLAPRHELPAFERNVDLLNALDTSLRRQDGIDPLVEGLDRHRQTAFNMLRSPRLREALDLSREPRTVIDRYTRAAAATGQNPNHDMLGNPLHFLLARRLVEVGVPVVHFKLGYWDWHSANFASANRQVPQFDLGLSLLLDDLEDRGLMDSTIVLALGEMGRTSAVNGGQGRDHNDYAQFVIAAGGGFRRGAVVGATDRQGDRVTDAFYKVESFGRTLYHLMGVDPDTIVTTPTNRPVRLIVEDAPLIREAIV